MLDIIIYLVLFIGRLAREQASLPSSLLLLQKIYGGCALHIVVKNLYHTLHEEKIFGLYLLPSKQTALYSY